jgi:hypothetical protein
MQKRRMWWRVDWKRFLPFAIPVLFLTVGVSLASWTTPIEIASSVDDELLPTAAPYDSNQLWTVWWTEVDPIGVRVEGNSFDGDTWSGVITIAPDTLTTDLFYSSPGVTVDSSGNIWVAWYHGSHPVASQFDWGVYTTVYDGFVWSEPSLAESALASHVKMATRSDGTVFLFWSQDTLCSDGMWGCTSVYMAWYNGATWSPPYPVALSHRGPSYDLGYYSSSMAADDSGGIWLAYVGYALPDTGGMGLTIIVDYFKGDSLENRHSLGTGYGSLLGPRMAVDADSDVWLVWSEYAGGNHDIYYSGPMGFGRLTTEPGIDFQPSLTCDDSGRVWVAWTSASGGQENIRVARYDGSKWEREYVTADPQYYDTNPFILADNTGRVWVFWQRDDGRDENICASYFYGQMEGVNSETYPARSAHPLALRAYPNPFRRNAIVTCTESRRCGIRISIHDVAGRIVQRTCSPVIGDGLKPGVYFLRADDCKPIKVMKVE